MPRRLALPLSLALLACDRPVDLPADLGWGAPADVPYAGTQRLAVTNNADDTLSFLTLGPLFGPQALGTAPVGFSPFEPEGPHHVAASPDGRYLYFNLSNAVPAGGGGPHGAHGNGTVPGYLVKLDARTNRPAGQVLVDRNPGDLILSKDGRLAFVSHYDLLRYASRNPAQPETGYSRVAIVATETMQVLALVAACPTTHGMGLSPDEQRLYVTCTQSDELAVLDVSVPAMAKVLRRVPVIPGKDPNQPPTAQPYALKVHPQSGAIWVSNLASYDVRAFDPDNLEAAPRVVRLDGVAMFSDLSVDGQTLYVPLQKTAQVPERLAAVDVATATVRDSVDLDSKLCQAPHVVQRLPDGRGLVVICEGDQRTRPGAALYLSTFPLALTGAVTLGLYPDGVALVSPMAAAQ